MMIQMLSGMDFKDFPNQTSLAVGNTMSVKGCCSVRQELQLW